MSEKIEAYTLNASMVFVDMDLPDHVVLQLWSGSSFFHFLLPKQEVLRLADQLRASAALLTAMPKGPPS